MVKTFIVLILIGAGATRPCAAESIQEKSPQELLKKMLAADSNGDASERFDLASKHSVNIDEKGKRLQHQHGPAFELDADPVIIGNSWEILQDQSSCGTRICTLRAEFIQIGKSQGFGSPSWMSTKGRELQVLKPSKVCLSYKFTYEGGKWKLAEFPVPVISTKALGDFFKKELESERNLQSIEIKNPEEKTNIEVLHDWRSRQLELLLKMDIANPALSK